MPVADMCVTCGVRVSGSLALAPWALALRSRILPRVCVSVVGVGAPESRVRGPAMIFFQCYLFFTTLGSDCNLLSLSLSLSLASLSTSVADWWVKSHCASIGRGQCGRWLRQPAVGKNLWHGLVDGSRWLCCACERWIEFAAAALGRIKGWWRPRRVARCQDLLGRFLLEWRVEIFS